MYAATAPVPTMSPALARLAALVPLSADDLIALDRMIRRQHTSPARREIVASGSQTPQTLLIDGWAFRSCLTVDGRRQITQLLIPGDLIAAVATGDAHASTVTALTPVTYCHVSDLHAGTENGGVARVASASNASDLKYLHRHIARLGRMDALQRTVDWLLEMRERLELIGQVHGETFPLPMTQELIADVLGLTSVHVNRTLQALRRDGLVQIGEGQATFRDRRRCKMIVGRFR